MSNEDVQHQCGAEAAVDNSVAVITPVFNGEKSLPRLWGSLLKQTHTNWRWIVVDDGSVDGTLGYLRSLSDSRVVVVSQTNQGVAMARNAALKLVDTAYFTFVDADDDIPSRSLEARVSVFEQFPDTDFVDGAITCFSSVDGAVTRKYVPREASGDVFFQSLMRLDEECFFGVFLLFRSQVKFMEPTLRYCEDLLFLIDYSREFSVRRVTSEVCYHYYTNNADSAMANVKALCIGYGDFIAVLKAREYTSFRSLLAMRLRVSRIVALSARSAGCLEVVPMVLKKIWESPFR